MEKTPVAAQEFSDSVKHLEAEAGQELLDEARFSKGVQVSFKNFADHVNQNVFLEESEKTDLTQKVDEKVSGLLKEALSKFDGGVAMLNEAAIQDLMIKMDLLSKESVGLINGLMNGVERQLRAKQTGFEGISDAEFREIVASLAKVEKLPDYILSEADSVSDAVGQVHGPAVNGLLVRSELGGEPVYIKAAGPDSVLLFTVTEPKLCIKVSTTPVPTEGEFARRITETRTALERENSTRRTEAQNLGAALSGRPEALVPMETGWDKLSATQSMAVESAYNMGLDAARSVKMQLLVFKIAQEKGYPLPDKFVLDGGWGPTSRTALQSILTKESLPYVEGNDVQNIKTLRDLHHKVFPSDNTELFLTAEEINDPRYKFENKGVYRGMKVRAVKERLLANGFDVETLAQEKVFGNDITPKVKAAFPRALAVLRRLTPNKDLQASILATMIMETGLSSGADDWGVGRADRKDYARYMSENWPRTSAVYNEYVPGPSLETNSSGIMQINYKTAQAMLQEKLGEYYPKDVLIDKLESSVELSTVVAFMVYQDNQAALQKAEKTYSR